METGPRVAHAVSSAPVPLLHGCVTVPLTVTWPAAWTNVTGQVGGLSHADAAPPKRCAKTEWLFSITPLRHIAQTTASCGMARFRGQCFVEMAPAAHPLR